MIFAGVGSRETPPEILQAMFWIAEQLCDEGATLRSGAAPGADQAFENGYAFSNVRTRKEIQQLAEIYLPWPSFEKARKSWIRPKLTEPDEAAYEIAARFHPSWQWLKQGARKLHARNVHQVLGADLVNPTLSDCVICWTKGAKGGGGTGQAIRLAAAYEVPVFDLADPEQLRDLCNELNLPLP